MNSPTTIGISWTTFLIANPRRKPPTNPPPMAAEIGVKRSVLKPSSPREATFGYGCT